MYSNLELGIYTNSFIYLARVFNTEIDTVVKWFIFILIFVFDPLAVSLVIAANMAFEIGSGKKEEKSGDWKEANVADLGKREGKKWWEIYKDKKPEDTITNEKLNELEKGGVSMDDNTPKKYKKTRS